MGSTKAVIVAVLVVFGSVSGDQKRQVISTVLNAKWQHTPFVLEAAEFLSEESEDAFWGLMDHMADKERMSHPQLTDRETYENILSFASRYLTWNRMNLLKFSLSLRSYSPRVEMFNQIASDYEVDKLDCDAVVQHVGSGKLACGEGVDLARFAAETSDSGVEGNVFQLDHHHPHRDGSAPSVVLYAQPGTKTFANLHKSLRKLASEGKVDYVLRPFVKNRESSPTRLSGYGVELQIKSTEYKAQDDRKVEEDGGESVDEGSSGGSKEVKGFMVDKLRELHPEKLDKLNEFEQHLTDQSYQMAPLKVWQLQDLSLQAATRIMGNSGGESQLQVLEDLSQNFPAHARALSSINVPKNLKKEVKKNRELFMSSLRIGPKDTSLFINGLQFDVDFLDMFSLLDVLKSESKTLEGMGQIGLTDEQVTAMTLLDLTSSKNKQSFGIDIRSTAVQWINDVEKDKGYEGWPKSVQELLRPSFPGMLRSIRKNFFHVVVMCDPADKSSIQHLRTLDTFLSHRAPTKLGLVFAVNVDASLDADVGLLLSTAYSFVAKEKDRRSAFAFLIDVYDRLENDDLTVEKVKKIFTSFYGDVKQLSDHANTADFESELDAAVDFVRKSGFNKFPKVLTNGIPLDQNDEDLEEALIGFVMKETNALQRAVYNGHLTDTDDVLDYLMDRDHILPRLNDRILGSNVQHIEFGGDTLPNLKLDTFAVLSKPSKASTLARHLPYLTMKEDPKLNILSCWVVANLETKKGRALFRSAVEHVKSSNNMRIAIVHNVERPGVVSRIVQAALETQSNTVARNLVGKVVKKEATVEALESGKKSVTDYDIPGADMKALQARMAELKADGGVFEIHSEFAASLPGFEAKDFDRRGLLLNGKVIGPLENDEPFDVDDFDLLDRFAMSAVGEALVQSFYSVMGVSNGDPRTLSDQAMKVSALLSSRPQETLKTRLPFVFESDKHSVIEVEPVLPEKPKFDIIAVVDPSSQGAQKLSTVLRTLHKVLNARVRVFLNCVDKHSEMPQKSFFRMVLEPELAFSGDDLTSGSYLARFVDLPKTPVYTMLHHIPENWLTGPVKSKYDLDNIKLESIDGNVYSEFELEHLLLEGHCFEAASGNPPRGLQLTLGGKSRPVLVDTIVMANLGYFQLKSNPGRWLLNIREGRSSDIYSIDSHENTENATDTKDVQVIISSFKSAILKLKVAKNSDEELLGNGDGDGDGDNGLWGKIKSTFGGSEAKAASAAAENGTKEDVINIFCLASGHLYERLLKIMMLSVKKHTDAKVKFWILKNYLSPSLKEFVPEFANRYGFEFEYVQYKWPRWLNQQSEKQRIIWGYKILFLDVLFPLDVKKIIFVDTDQVVRADLRELRDLDLKGAPYGYTPFCDSNKEMEGFRFWKQGYWRSHLAGRKYHISALYVVDLVKFRQIAAGDRLRGQYQALSQDPNSLSNLDQDLPNNMIHQVPIFSLPQEWLYCETWCSRDTLKDAKSIDLCNNPLTKEPKLDAARRIVSEWTDYDDEMQELAKAIKEDVARTTTTSSKPIHSASSSHQHEDL